MQHPKNHLTSRLPETASMLRSLRDERLQNRIRFHYFSPHRDSIVTESPAAAEILRDRFRELSTNVVYDSRITQAGADYIQINHQRQVPCDILFWLSTENGPRWLKSTALGVDSRGFIAANNNLESSSHEGIFASSYMKSDRSDLTISKVSGYGTRIGKVLAQNLVRRFYGLPQLEFHGVAHPTVFISLGEKSAMILRGKWAVASGRVWSLKEGLDTRWLNAYRTPLRAARIATFLESGSLTEPPCKGEGAVIPAELTEWIPERTSSSDRACSLITSAGTQRPKQSSSSVKETSLPTLFLSSQHQFVSDLYSFGLIGAGQALLDIHAQGMTPVASRLLAEVAFGTMKTMSCDLYEMISGATAALENVGENHQISASPPKSAPESCLQIASHAKKILSWDPTPVAPGDHIIVSKALGTGVIMAGYRQHHARTSEMETAIQAMSRNHDSAIKRLANHLIKAASAVGGHGLAHALLNIVDVNGLCCQVALDTLPVLPGAARALAQGIRSSVHTQNRLRFTNQLNRINKSVFIQSELLFDAQTAGGIAFAVAEKNSAEVLRILKEEGLDDATVIGSIVNRNSPTTLIEFS
jgi:selenide, water dikinase